MIIPINVKGVGTGQDQQVASMFWQWQSKLYPRLQTVAELAGKECGEIIVPLAINGISVSDPSMTIRQIAKQNQKKEMEELGLVFR